MKKKYQLTYKYYYNNMHKSSKIIGQKLATNTVNICCTNARQFNLIMKINQQNNCTNPVLFKWVLIYNLK